MYSYANQKNKNNIIILVDYETCSVLLFRSFSCFGF